MDRLDILIVEDNPNDAYIMQRIIEKQSLADNYQWLQDGEKAIQYLFAESQPLPRLILLDIQLPKVNGLEVLDKIKSNASTTNIPVIMFSSSDQTSDIETSYQSGANSYLVKPTSYAELNQTLQLAITYWLNLNKTIK